MSRASTYSMNGAMVYQYGNRRVVVRRNHLGGSSPLREYQLRERGEWRVALSPRGADSVIAKVFAELRGAQEARP